MATMASLGFDTVAQRPKRGHSCLQSWFPQLLQRTVVWTQLLGGLSADTLVRTQLLGTVAPVIAMESFNVSTIA
jgi:hypothetical protein